MIKITSSGKTIRLINNYSLSEPPGGFVSVEVSSAKEVSDFYNILINSDEVNEIHFYNTNVQDLFQWFSSMFTIVEAAGGLVKNENGSYLFIFRNGKWDLPKGKIEKGETIRDAAVREVEEECGINGLTILKELPTTYHTYTLGNNAVLKPTYWFEMKCSGHPELVPQTEEGITEVKWMNAAELETVRENTFPSIIDLIAGL